MRKLGLKLAITGMPTAKDAKAEGFPVFALFHGGRARTTLLLWFAFFMNLLVMYFLVNWLPTLLKASGQTLQVAIFSTAVLNAGGVIGGVVFGRMIDRFNPIFALGCGYFGAAFFIAVAATHATDLAILMVSIFIAGSGIVGAQISMNALTATIYPTAIRSTGVGWALGIGRTGAIVGPVAGGNLLAMGWNARSLVLAAVVPSAIAGLAVCALHKQDRRQPIRSPASEAAK